MAAFIAPAKAVAFYGLLSMAIAGAVPGSARAEARLTRIEAVGMLRVCIWPGYYAISFRNPRNGELQGIDIDMAKAFAEDLGRKLTIVESSFATFMDDLEQDKCDVAMFAIGDTAARRERVDMSAPHLRSGMYAITRKNTTVRRWADLDQPGHVIAVQKGTVMEPYMRSALKSAELKVVAPPGTREEELLAGRADAFMTDYPYAQRMRFQHDWAVVIEPPEPVAPTNYGYAVRKGDPQWLARVNDFVAAIKRDGRLLAAAERHGLAPIAVRN